MSSGPFRWPILDFRGHGPRDTKHWAMPFTLDMNWFQGILNSAGHQPRVSFPKAGLAKTPEESAGRLSPGAIAKGIVRKCNIESA